MTSFAAHLATAQPSLWALDGEVPAAAVAATCRAAGFDVRTVDLAGVKNKSGLLAAFARDLDFPSWCGRNWDALADCLGDLSWLPRSSRVILVTGTTTLARVAASDWRTALDIMEEAAEFTAPPASAPDTNPPKGQKLRTATARNTGTAGSAGTAGTTDSTGSTGASGRLPLHFVTLP